MGRLGGPALASAWSQQPCVLYPRKGGAHRAGRQEPNLWWGCLSPSTAPAGSAQAHCYQAVISSLALQPTLQTVGWAASQTASALLSEVQGERVCLTESRVHFQSHQSCHEILDNPVRMGPRSSWLPPSSWLGLLFQALGFVELSRAGADQSHMRGTGLLGSPGHYGR